MELRRTLRLFWYRSDREAWVFVAIIVGLLTTFAVVLVGAVAYQEERRQRAKEVHRQNVACLARNIYYEARGEPLAGQFAVAEVTMNRKASRHFPRTVCEVVYQKNWDPIRKRQVGAFSWTEFDAVPEPLGDEWVRALAIAEAVYYSRHQPAVHGALFYHANYIKPSWAREKRPVARIGRHIFYR